MASLKEAAANINAFAIRLEELAKPSPRVVRAAANVGLHDMLERTAKGLDKFGQPFPAYSTERLYISRASEYGSLAQSAGGRTSYLSKEEIADRKGDYAKLPKVYQTKEYKKGARYVTYEGSAETGTLRRVSYQDKMSRHSSTRTTEMRSVEFDGGYAQFKRGLGHSTVDLSVTGRLLGSIAITRVTDNVATIDFIEPLQSEKAAGLTGRGFDFFGCWLIEEERTRAMEAARAAYIEQLNGAIPGSEIRPDTDEIPF